MSELEDYGKEQDRLRAIWREADKRLDEARASLPDRNLARRQARKLTYATLNNNRDNGYSDDQLATWTAKRQADIDEDLELSADYPRSYAYLCGYYEKQTMRDWLLDVAYEDIDKRRDEILAPLEKEANEARAAFQAGIFGALRFPEIQQKLAEIFTQR